MKIKAELSLYPLETGDYEKTINAFIDGLAGPEVRVTVGAMSTVIRGERDAVFNKISTCFARAAADARVILTAKFEARGQTNLSHLLSTHQAPKKGIFQP